MAEEETTEADVSAEKAYAAAAEAVPLRPEGKPLPEPVAEAPTEPPVAVATEPVEFPAKARRARKPVAPAVVTPPVVVAPVEPVKVPLPKVRKPAAKKPAKPAVIKAKPKAAKPKPAVAKPVSKPLSAKPAMIAKPAIVSKHKAPVAKPAAAALKDKTMEKTAEFTEGLKKVAAETQAKAKTAFDKGSAMFGDYAEFAKGNVEAVVESGKILAAGMQKMGSEMVAEGKTAFETATADAKQFAAVKSPSDFLKLQSEVLRRNIDSAVALSTKNSETMMKLASDSFAPISGRFSLAMGKFKKAA